MPSGRAGFIGLGKMGKPMSQRLMQAGYEVVVHNRSRGVVDELVAEGAKAGSSPRDVAERSDFVFTCLPTPDSVEAVYLGTDGVAAGGHSGQIWIDHSTVSPATNTRCAEAAAAKGAAFLDAPISGGPARATDGTLTMMIGGDPAVYDRALPLFQALGQNIKLCGGQTTGTIVKLVNQLLVGVHTIAAVEGFVMGVKAGADPQVMLDLLGTSFGASAMLNRHVPLMLKRNFAPATPANLILKDLGLIHGFCQDLGVRALLTATSLELFKEAKGLGFGDDDMSGMVRPAETIAGVQVVSAAGG
jgi:3-hydroxyisobutyrate dehydrogenase/2-hydroxy-3-oxopropionate reductase